MPFDSSRQTSDIFVSAVGGERPSVGSALRAKRQTEGRTLESVAQETRVRRAYLQAIEESNWSALPPGPYVCGYVKLYAEAVGLNGEKAIQALKEETPDAGAALPPPMGLAHQERRRVSPLIVGVVGALALAFVGWNISQRAALPSEDVVAPPVEAAWLNSGSGSGLIRIGAATPAPADQNAPTPYETPGLAAAVAAQQAAGPVAPGAPGAPTVLHAAPPTSATAASVPASAGGVPAAAQTAVGAAFNPRAAIHGAAPQDSRITVQARQSASIVVRRPNGDILFARQLAPGEAYRAPLDRGLVLDVSDPTAFDVYRDGEFRGQLRDQQSGVDGYLG